MMRVDRESPNKYFDESDASYEARKIWYAFKDVVLYKDRFFVKHQLLDILSKYVSENILRFILVKYSLGQELLMIVVSMTIWYINVMEHQMVNG